MKKGMVLLMSLLFITILSGFIFKTLQYTDTMIDKSVIEDERAQLCLSLHNIKEQIIDLVYQKKETLEDMLPIDKLEFGVKGTLDLKINTIELFNNKINIYKQTLSPQLAEYIKDMEFTSNKQLQAVLTKYFKTNEDQTILDIQENLTYFDTELNEHIYCSFDILLKNIQGSSIFIFNKNTKEVVDFEFIFTK